MNFDFSSSQFILPIFGIFEDFLGLTEKILHVLFARPYNYIQVYAESAIFFIVSNYITLHILTNATSKTKP